MEPVKVFLDTNIVLDYFTGRMGDGLAGKIVQIGRGPVYQLCISMLTAVNVLYVAKKVAPMAVTPEAIAGLFTILPQDIKQWNDASTLEMADFEDALQASCALNSNCYIAVSRDPHFKVSPMVTFSPAEFIDAVTR